MSAIQSRTYAAIKRLDQVFATETMSPRAGIVTVLATRLSGRRPGCASVLGGVRCPRVRTRLRRENRECKQ